MKKGVAPILATVLIVLVAIALAGTFLIWSSRTLTSTTERGTEDIQRIGASTSEGILIVALSCKAGTANDQITIKNTGSADLQTSQISVFENETLRTVTWTSPGTIPPNRINTSVSGFAWTGFVGSGLDTGDTIRVVTRQGTEDSARCQ